MATAIDDQTDNNNDVESTHPFKVFKTKDYLDNDEGQLGLCVEHVQLLSSRDSCKNHTNSRKKVMGCKCLAFLHNEVYWEAAGNWMVDFGNMNRQEQQRVIIEKIRHANSLSEGFDIASQDPRKNILFCLPFIMTAPVEDNGIVEEDDGSRAMAFQALNGPKICKSALMELILAKK
jgi:hypothetical protein